MHTNDSKDKLSKLGKGKSGKLEGRMSLEEAQRILEEAQREGIPLEHLVISPGYEKRSEKQPETGTPGSSTGPTKTRAKIDKLQQGKAPRRPLEALPGPGNYRSADAGRSPGRPQPPVGEEG